MYDHQKMDITLVRAVSISHSDRVSARPGQGNLGLHYDNHCCCNHHPDLQI